ncbi:MAG: penicillin-binding protein 2 [Flavobacteriales bacterium]|nr:penicillin-binding protein 2 [Flavobacteriales bacterium]
MRDKFLQLLIIFISSILVLQLFFLQVINKQNSELEGKASVQKIYNFPERGYVYDRNDKLIVSNEPYYDILIVPNDVKISDSTKISKDLNISVKDFKSKYNKALKFSKIKASIFLSSITKEEYAQLQEKMWRLSGFFIQKNSKRKYNYSTASNLLGYISEVNDYEIKNNAYYKSGETIGRQGLEKTYELVLRGKKGVNYFQKDKFNRIIGKYNNGIYDTMPEIPKKLKLTLDIDLQVYGDSLMKNKYGSIIAIDPKSGEILALVNSPGYDPNLLVGRQRSSEYRLLNNDSIGKPLFERGLQGQYPPGSTFKIINALIGLQENIIQEKTSFRCDGGHFYAKNSFMKCHTKEATFSDLNNAIYTSCNTYFAKTYKGIIENYETSSIGLDKWSNYVKSFGFGNYLGYDHPTGKPGFIPSSDYYNKWYNNSWRAVTTISNSIGQGEILTTPIQLANFAAIIANRGWYITPHFVKEIERDSLNNNYKKKNKTLIDSKYFEPIIEGMVNVIEKGTATNSRISNIKIAGKTGTAENFVKIDGVKKQLTDHSIFIGFAPADDPQIAICVFIENGYWGSRWAAPISSLMIEKFINQDVERKWLEKYITNGDLSSEYLKPYLKKNFTINE